MSNAIHEVDSQLEVSQDDSLYGGNQKDTSGPDADNAVPEMLFSNQNDSLYQQSAFNYHAKSKLEVNEISLQDQSLSRGPHSPN